MTEAPEQVQEQSAPETQEEAEPFFVARTQDDLNKKVGDLRQQVRSSLLKDLGFEDLDDLKETVEAYRLVEQETQTEAERYQRELEKYRPRAEKAERYEQALKNYLDKERDGMEEHIISLLDRMDPVEQLSYINEHRDKLKKPADVGKPFSFGDEPVATRNPFSDEHFNLTEQGRLWRENPELAARLKKAAGKA